MRGILTRNQYLITEGVNDSAGCGLSADVDKQSLLWNGLSVTSWAPLEVTADREDPGSTVLLIGYALDPAQPSLSNREIAAAIATGQDRWDLIDRLSGRFVLLIRDEGTDEIYAVTDAASQRQLYFWEAPGQLVASSMPELILGHLGESARLLGSVRTLFDSARYRQSGLPWFGNAWYDARIRRLIPNHVLKLKAKTVSRLRLLLARPTDAKESVHQAADILAGGLAAVHHRYEVHQPVTAGFDSRVVLAASRDHRGSTCYFIFDRGPSTAADVKVASRLANRLGLTLRTIPVAPVASHEFRQMHQRAFVTSSMGPLLSNSEHHYTWNRDRNVVVVTGNGGEVARNRYIEPAGDYSLAELLIQMFGGYDVFRDGIGTWCEDLLGARRELDPGLRPLDLFYWEQYLPYNKSRISQENDLAIETFMPFNNRHLLLLLLSTPPGWRYGPGYSLFRRLCERLWPETLSQPFNPLEGLQMRKRFRRMVLKHGRLSRHLIGHYYGIQRRKRGSRWPL